MNLKTIQENILMIVLIVVGYKKIVGIIMINVC